MPDPFDRQILEDNLPFWSKLSSGEQKTLELGTQRFSVIKGATLHDDRNKCTGLLLVASGQLRVYMISEAGKEITLYRLFERDVCILSASCLMNNITFDVHVQALADTVFLRMTTEAYHRVSANNPSVQDFTNQLVSSRFSDVMWVVEQIVFMSFDKRLAIYLLDQSAIAQSDVLDITHEVIARDLGTAREVVTRMLNRFQEEKLVTLFRGGITLVDRDGLNDLT
ncbi:MAG: Crp/Fnr family transcriptional regulator [Sphaerochaetaceae bacterium]